MASETEKRRSPAYATSSSMSILSAAESISWCTSLFLVLMLVMSLCQGEEMEDIHSQVEGQSWNGGLMKSKLCDEIYVVGEGETLQTIGDKCNDPYIVENNPHIHDPDDVFPGLLIKITPVNN